MEFSIPPHNGTLSRLLADPETVERLKAEARDVCAVVLSPRRLSDLDRLLNGGFSPLSGFLGRADYESVLDAIRLGSNLPWPGPVTLDVPAAATAAAHPGVRYLHEQIHDTHIGGGRIAVPVGRALARRRCLGFRRRCGFRRIPAGQARPYRRPTTAPQPPAGAFYEPLAFGYPEVIDEPRRVCPPRGRQGFTL